MQPTRAIDVKRLTKHDLPLSFGAFKPVGYLVVALPDDDRARDAARALKEEGFGDQDLLVFSADEMEHVLRDILPAVSPVALGFEARAMHELYALADEGCGIVMVFAPDDATTRKALDVVRRFGAKRAYKYNHLVIEELI